jgi:hypothetical protein
MTTWDEVSRHPGTNISMGRNELPWALETAVSRKQLTDLDEIARGIEDAWTSAEFPMTWMHKREWKYLYNLVGFLEDDRRAERPVEPVTVYRGATRGLRLRWSWTDDLDQAEWFANRLRSTGNDARIWTMKVPPQQVLAHFTKSRGENEWVIDPTGIKIIEHDLAVKY